MSKGKSKSNGKLDLRDALRAPIKVKQDGQVKSLDP